MTLGEWAALAEDEPGELVDDLLEEEEMASFVHEVVVAWLIRMLGNWASSRGVFVVGSDLKLGVSSRRGRKADLAVYFRRGKIEARGLVTVPPDIAVEIVSPGVNDQRRDRVDKRREYAAFGVRYYWLVSPEARLIEILELGSDGRYIHALDLSAGTSPIVGCEGLELDLDDLWREVERAEREEAAP
jgi:Uma2 family endonuclease